MIAIVGIIPAYAGSTHLVLAPLVAGPGSSPHTRGAPDGRNTTSSPTPDHPRIRGEHDASGIQGPFDAGSSPHTRGAPTDSRSPSGAGRIIPAYAGSTFAGLPGKIVKADHPRIRGEHAIMHVYPPVSRGSSPHTRGARIRQERGRSRWRIIPAYAGSTSIVFCRRCRKPDHPRIRGEHLAVDVDRGSLGGSSPHTRGAHHR